ncbi:variant surface antigen E-like [Uranotaenia lowii]|uniref:variant surface antigen E-like n=1 Tax=Uranotaenia lowii TaxID=190385 RepID=UPI00247ADC75|nr:variant surface antigen E-like [Uranotaenia lowii]
MFSKTIFGLFGLVVALSFVPRSEAFGTDLLEYFFGSYEDSSEGNTVIKIKPNNTVSVMCASSCDLTVECMNCNKVVTDVTGPDGTMTTSVTSVPMTTGSSQPSTTSSTTETPTNPPGAPQTTKAKQESPTTDPPKTDPPKTDPPNQEPSNQEPSNPEPPKSEESQPLKFR